MSFLRGKVYAYAACAAACSVVMPLRAASTNDAARVELASRSAIALTRDAVQAFRNQELASAVTYSRQALAKSDQALPEEDAGLDELILAKADVFSGQREDALTHYQQALEHFRKSGPKMLSVLSLSYAELALLYTQEGSTRKAEESIGRAKSAEAEVVQWTADERAYLRDMEIHLQCSAGRLTEARNTLRQTIDLFEGDARLSGHSRAHLYRDYAQVSFAAGQDDVAIDYLHRSIEALKKDPEPWRDAMFTRTMLAEYQVSRHQDEEAEANYKTAIEEARTLEGKFPGESARVFTSWAYYLTMRNRWAEARGAIQQAVSLTNGMQMEMAANAKYLHLLAKVDRHLHQRHEAAEAEHRAQDESVSAKLAKPAEQMTVDVLALQASR